MRKITFLLTLLLMYVGVTPMMAAEDLVLDESKTYSIKIAANGYYIFADKVYNKLTYELKSLGVDDLTDDYLFKFIKSGTTTDGHQVYKIQAQINSYYVYRDSSYGYLNSNVDHVNNNWVVVVNDNGTHTIRWVQNTSGTLTLSDKYWYPMSSNSPLYINTNGAKDLVIEVVGDSGDGGSGETTTNILPAGVQVSATPTVQKEWVKGSHFFYTIKNGNGQYLTNDVKVGENFTFKGSTMKPDKSGYWCVVGNGQDGYSFYNYETGQILAMSSSKILDVNTLESYSMAYLRDIGALQGADDHRFVFTKSKVEGQSLFCIKVLNTENIYWIAHSKFLDKLGYRKNDDALSNPAAGFIFEEVDPFKPIDEDLTIDLINEAESAMAKTGVGYPTAACPERAPLNAAIAAATKNPTSQDLYDGLADAYKNFLKSPNVTMPEDGKAYVFKNKDTQSILHFLYDNNGDLSFSQEDYSGVCPVEAKFICRKLSVSDNGTSANYAFVNNNGQFLIWKGDQGGNDNNDGFAKDYSPVTLKKMVGADEDLSELFGTMTIGESGKLFARNSTGGFSTKDVTGDLYTSDFSTAFILEEVSYPNIVTLTEVTADDKLCKGFVVEDVPGVIKTKTIATFSAPFATVIPEGVTAYWATNSDGYVKLQSFSAGKHLPANFGVILVGENNGITSALMKPRTTEELVQIGNDANHFENSAGATTTTVAGDYVLADGGQGIGFYEAIAGGTLAMNKAFLRMGASNVAAFRLVVDEEVTAIDGVATEKADAPIYDLSGRRVLNTVKGGIYIQNGKKFIVK